MNRPFDKARYTGLLKGLEVAEIPLSALERTMRVDAEYFQPTHLRIAKVVAAHHSMPITEVASVSDGNHFSISEEFAAEGVPYYRGQDVVGHFFIGQASPAYINESAFLAPHMVRSYLKRGDVLLSIVGTVGEISLVEADSPATCSCKLAILRPTGIAAEYLAIFLQSAHGRSQIRRLTRGAVQMGLLLADMDQIEVARLSPEFEKQVVHLVEMARQELQSATMDMSLAEKTLLNTVGLENWKPSEKLTFVQKASDVFDAARFDADFFEPRYATMVSKMETHGVCVDLESLLTVNRRGKQPDYQDTGTTVINSKHVLKNQVRNNADNALAAVPDESLKIKYGDVLINGTGVGTIGRAAAYLHKESALPDNHVTILRPKSGAIDPVYLAIYLNTIAGQWQVEKYLRGSSGQIEIYPADIARFKIFLAPKSVQLKIHELVEGAFSARSKANALLAAAKHAVELAIERNEGVANTYLKKQGV